MFKLIKITFIVFCILTTTVAFGKSSHYFENTLVHMFSSECNKKCREEIGLLLTELEKDKEKESGEGDLSRLGVMRPDGRMTAFSVLKGGGGKRKRKHKRTRKTHKLKRSKHKHSNHKHSKNKKSHKRKKTLKRKYKKTKGSKKR